jgi:hypothetical protein
MRSAVLILAGVLGFVRPVAAQAVVPVANAGPDVTVACAGTDGTPVTMDGLASSIGPDFTYLWTAPGVTFDDPTILTPIGVFPLGATEATLTVTFTDPNSDPNTPTQTMASDTVLVTIGDTTAPMLNVTPDPAQLWPPNHKFHDVHVDVETFDACDAAPAVVLLDIQSSEPDNGTGDGNTDGDIQGAELGTDDRDFALRAERAGPGDGRVYTAVYQVTDLGGNQTQAEALIVVPHDMGHGAAHGGDDGSNASHKDMAKAGKLGKKAAKQQWKAAKKAEKLGKKAYKAALKDAKKSS